jgi:hypothetical protein
LQARGLQHRVCKKHGGRELVGLVQLVGALIAEGRKGWRKGEEDRAGEDKRGGEGKRIRREQGKRRD